MLVYILQYNCSIGVCDSSGNTPLHYCSRYGPYRIASFLVARGADVNIRNKSGKSPLDLAKLGKHNDIVELLEKAVLEGPQGMLIACLLIACFQLRIQTVLSRLGQCKSWTLDSGLDHGLDYELEYGLNSRLIFERLAMVASQGLD